MEKGRHVHLVIKGRVQGVWFRAGTRETAEALGIQGWVKNLPDQSVEVDATGGTESMERFIRWCYKGPPGARVTDVDISELDPPSADTQGTEGFKILR